MIDFSAILKANPNGVLVAQDGQGIHSRVFQYLFTDGNKVYFWPSREKPVYKKLTAHPNVSFYCEPACRKYGASCVVNVVRGGVDCASRLRAPKQRRIVMLRASRAIWTSRWIKELAA
ncbi:MAG: hypothetical protein FWH52_07515 [Synergistaceae bacterium]|nr:hypothetical protein [Synergistaceae bacterium]